MSWRTLRILGFEPYDSGAHRAVRESISRHSRHDWRWITRPGRAWKWRMRLSAIEMLSDAAERGWLDEPADVIFTTSLISAADLRALLPPPWRTRPLVLSMHENQIEYPVQIGVANSEKRDAHFALTNLTSLLAADLVIWNSAWNLQSFCDGLGALLRQSPDWTDVDVVDQIETKSRIIWPPVELPPTEDAVNGGIPTRSWSPSAPIVVWPHRWEHDKAPDELLRIIERDTERLNLRWIILGEQFREHPAEFETIRREWGSHIEHMGFVESRAEYWRLLRRADWVLSTARHEFFGIAVVEAMVAGCLPWLPDRLSYTELLPETARGLSPARTLDEQQATAIRATVSTHLEAALATESVRRIDQALAGSFD